MTGESTRSWNIGRDVTAAVLLCAASVLPWNLFFGVGTATADPRLQAAGTAATVLALGSLAATYVGPWRITGAHPNPRLLGLLRLTLAAPYLALVLGVVAFDAVQTIRYGGSAQPPGGVGPGAWLGAAGALLAAQPVLAGPARFWKRAVRAVGYASIIGAALSVAFNLYWRVHYALPDGAGEYRSQQVAIIVTAVVYGAVAWVTVATASRWILRHDNASQLAIVILGGATLVSGALVWVMPAGRFVDGFHGIAQNTSTMGVGFEGYLAWVAAAAIFAVVALRDAPGATWLLATRNILLLIIVWCVGSAIMRLDDIVVAATLGLPYSPYDSAAMAAFDVVTAVVAIWLRINLGNRSLPVAAVWSVAAVLFGFTIARLVVGVGLAPRLAQAQQEAALANPVYGNGLAQQITSTFDLVLCGLAWCAMVVAIISARFARSERPRPGDPGSPSIFRSQNATAKALGDGPKIYRGTDEPQGSSNGS